RPANQPDHRYSILRTRSLDCQPELPGSADSPGLHVPPLARTTCLRTRMRIMSGFATLARSSPSIPGKHVHENQPPYWGIVDRIHNSLEAELSPSTKSHHHQRMLRSG